jgi:hypothetical protein
MPAVALEQPFRKWSKIGGEFNIINRLLSSQDESLGLRSRVSERSAKC